MKSTIRCLTATVALICPRSLYAFAAMISRAVILAEKFPCPGHACTRFRGWGGLLLPDST